MIGSILGGLFGCAHRRLTRPITPVTKPGEPGGETYVVCLSCGAQFAYDWDNMRIGQRIKRTQDSGVLEPEAPVASKTKIKYALLGTAVPLAVFVGGALFSKRRGKPQAAEVSSQPALNAQLETFVGLPHGGHAAQFRVGQLVDHIQQSGRDYIIIGQIDCSFSDHPRRRSLDYWLRANFARNKETKQAVNAVLSQLIDTGLFELRDDLRCPDTGEKARGLRLRPTA